MPTIAQDAGMGCGRSAVVYLISLAVGLPLMLCGVLTTVWIASQGNLGPGTLVLLACIWLVPAALAVVFSIGAVRRRSAKLDTLFVPLGLQGSPYMTFFRQYHGERYGRRIDAYLWRGPFLQIEVGTALQTRMGITAYQSDTSFLADAFGAKPLALTDPAFASLSVWAIDESWARALLANREAAEAIGRLTALGSSIFTRQHVLLRPGAITVLLSGNTRLFGIDLKPEQTSLWIDDLVRAANVAEALPAPQVTAEISASERTMFSVRQHNPYLALWVGLGMLGFFAIVALVVFAIVFFVM